jgi:hypothetical protein
VDEIDNLKIWDKVRQPPTDALKRINGGRLSGMTDISPQWRLEIMTKIFGPCGTGWKYTIDRVWREEACDGQVFSFAAVSVYVKDSAVWSDAIPGTGGSMLVEKEKAGLHASDEGYKMAITDALSVAFKALGVGADIYRGKWDGSKYEAPPSDGVRDTLIAIENASSLDELKAIFEEAWPKYRDDPAAKGLIAAAKDEAKRRLGQ